MTRESERDKLDEQVWWRRAVGIAGAGFLFSVLTSLIVILMLGAGFPPAEALERSGADLSMRLFSEVATQAPPPGAPTYALLDIDPDACRTLLGHGSQECALGRPAPDALVWKTAAAAARAGAKIIIVDVTPPEDQAARKTLLEKLGGITSAGVIVPVHSRPGDIPGELLVDASYQPTFGRLRFAAFSTQVSPSEGGLVRSYPPRVAASLPNGQRISLPSAPYLAAELAGLPQEGLRLASGSTPWNIFYALPSLSQSPPLRRDALRDRLLGLWDRIEVSAQISSNNVDFPAGRLDNKVVVIASSSLSGEDVHSTPIGALSGGEIIINAVRTYLDYRPLAPLGIGSSIWRLVQSGLSKGSAAIGPTLLILLVLLGREKLFDRVQAPPLRVLIWLLAMALIAGGSFLLELFGGMAEVEDSARQGREVDIITPILAVGLDFYREAATAIVNILEDGVQWGLDISTAIFDRIGPRR